MVRLYVESVTAVYPAKAVERNEMPFGRDTRVVPGNIVLDRGSGSPRDGEIWGSESPVRNLSPYYFVPYFHRNRYHMRCCYYYII